MKRIFGLLLALCLASGMNAAAESRTFELGKWIEIEHSILKNLYSSYVDTIPTERMMKAAITSMLEQLDPYTIYVPEEDNADFELMISHSYGGIGAIIHKVPGENVIINEPYEGSPSARAGLQCGDEIIEVDGFPVLPLTAKESTDRMKGQPGTRVVFKVKKVRSNKIVNITVVREKIHLPDIPYAGMYNDTTGYIVQTGFTSGVAQELKKQIIALKKKGMKHLVYDLRGNGGGLLNEAVDIVSLFVPKKSLVVTAKAYGKDDVAEYRTMLDPIDTQLPITVLIDSGSASASEIVSGALQDLDRATVAGKRSFGKGLVQHVMPVAYNGQLKVTVAKYYTPSGRCVQAIDYSHRNEDGSVGQIPDSLTHVFYTSKGRPVRDGGGITPDIELPEPEYSRLVYSMVRSGIVDDYVMYYVRTHENLPRLDKFHFNDEDYEDFVQFAKEKKFDYRSSASALLDQMREALKKDGMIETAADELEALEKAVKIDKEQFIRLKKDELIPFIEEELAVRYYYQAAGVQIRLRYDNALKTLIEK
ncbi:MAG: S41 family peptidase [Bacteroidales bacterium]|nr:S41 family peptidase [Bacteroidales bacterium]